METELFLETLLIDLFNASGDGLFLEDMQKMSSEERTRRLREVFAAKQAAPVAVEVAVEPVKPKRGPKKLPEGASEKEKLEFELEKVYRKLNKIPQKTAYSPERTQLAKLAEKLRQQLRNF